MSYLTINIEQQTDEWRQWRQSKIGSSDIPAIMDVSPWKHSYILWREKLDMSDNRTLTRAMQRGIDLELDARKAFEQEKGIAMPPRVIQSIEKPWMISSLDGYNFDRKEILEIKCPGSKCLKMAKNKEIPIYYIYQMQHQLYMTGFDRCYYYCYDGEKGITIEVLPDQSIIKSIVEKATIFHDALVNMEPLPEWQEYYFNEMF